MHLHLRLPAFLLCAAAALCLVLAPSPARAADKVVTDCSGEAALRAALTAMQGSGGGTLTFACGDAPAPIVLTGGALPTITTNTVVDGGGVITLSGGNASRIFNVVGGASLTLKGLALVKGNGSGGGAVASIGSLTVADCTFRENRGGDAGGAILTYGPTTITNSEFSANQAERGGAVAFTSGGFATSTITGSRFEDNAATGTAVGQGQGGALAIIGGAAVTVETSTFAGNHAEQVGGAAYVAALPAAALTLRFVTLEGNRAFYSAAVHNEGATIISRSLVRGSVGLGAFAPSAVTNEGTLTLVNATLAENAGDAFYNDDERSATVAYTTIVANGGDGIFNNDDGVVTVRNTILAANGANCGPDAPILSQGYNISDDATCALNAAGDRPADTDPLLSDLGAWGGPTLSHRPLPGSLAIDNGQCIDGIPIDQRDFARPFGASCDIGAVEARRHALTVQRTGEGLVSSELGGIVCGETCTAQVWEWTQVSLTATPGAGYTFAGWGGACSGAGACQLSMSAPRTVSAAFMPASGKTYLPAVQK